MIRYGRTSQSAVAAASRLAEAHARGERVSSARIAKDRGLSAPLVAKLLTTLAQAGLVHGTRGPGGGYTLARDPGSIRLFDIVELFDRVDEPPLCPFGPDWCGTGEPCPLHHTYVDLLVRMEDALRRTTLDVFAKHGAPPNLEAAPRGAAK